jgi:hypothetical protein
MVDTISSTSYVPQFSPDNLKVNVAGTDDMAHYDQQVAQSAPKPLHTELPDTQKGLQNLLEGIPEAGYKIVKDIAEHPIRTGAILLGGAALTAAAVGGSAVGAAALTAVAGVALLSSAFGVVVNGVEAKQDFDAGNAEGYYQHMRGAGNSIGDTIISAVPFLKGKQLLKANGGLSAAVNEVSTAAGKVKLEIPKPSMPKGLKSLWSRFTGRGSTPPAAQTAPATPAQPAVQAPASPPEPPSGGATSSPAPAPNTAAPATPSRKLWNPRTWLKNTPRKPEAQATIAPEASTPPTTTTQPTASTGSVAPGPIPLNEPAPPAAASKPATNNAWKIALTTTTGSAANTMVNKEFDQPTDTEQPPVYIHA